MLNAEITPRSNRTATLERPRVLVVVADPNLRASLHVGLGVEGFEISAFADTTRAELLVGQGTLPAAAIIDASLPTAEVLALVSRFAGRKSLIETPVLLLGAPSSAHLESLSVLTGLAFALPANVPQGDIAALLRLDLHRLHSHVSSFEASLVPADRMVRGLISTRRSARLVLAGGRAELIVADGRFLRATFDATWGIDAVCRALALTHGRYQVSLEPVRMVPEFHCSLKELNEVVLPRLARWELTVQRGVPLAAILQVDFKRLVAALPTLPDELNRLVQLCDGTRDTRAVVADSPFDEVVSLEALTRLYLMGVLAPVGGEPEALMPRAMPRLFEPENRAALELMDRLFGDLPAPEILGTGTPAARDWFEPVRGTGLEVADPSAGWLSAPVFEAPAELKAELAPALSRQLEAFNVAAEVEPREAKKDEKPVELFSDGKDEAEEPGLEVAMQTASLAQAPRMTPPMTPMIQPEAMYPSRHERADQRRIATPPVMTAVKLADAPVPAPRPSLDRLAAAFFARPSAPAPDPTLTSREQLEAFEATAQQKRKASKLAISAAVAVAVVVAAIAAEALMMKAEPAAAVPAPMAQPVKAPAPVVAAPAPVVEEAAPAPELIDVSEPLALGTRAYEAGQFKKAVSMLEQVTADAPGNARGWLFLGLARYDLGNLDGATSAAEKALAIDAGNARAWILLASVQQEKGNLTASKTSLQKAIAADPSGPFADEARALLR